MAPFLLEVTEADAGARLDVVLARRIPELSRARAKALIDGGGVRVQGRLAPKSHIVSAGDQITLERLPGPVDFHAAPDPDTLLDVLVETDDFVIVHKPAGLPSHPLRSDETHTLAGALVARYPEMRDVGYRKREPGILHRLDTNTSGVMLAARNAVAFDALRARLRAGDIEKRYLARCLGRVSAPGAIALALANDPRDRRKVRACSDAREIRRLRARPARTEILSSTPAAHGSLVEVRANHARRHQVRAHLAAIGHPLLGDTLYGGPALRAPAHHLLHASFMRVGEISAHARPWNHSNSEPELVGRDAGS